MESITTLEFWQKVKEDLDHTRSLQHWYHLCDNNKTKFFRDTWYIRHNRNMIKVLAKEFIASSEMEQFQIEKSIVIGSNVLFYDHPKFNSFDLRLKFIDWCIEKFKQS